MKKKIGSILRWKFAKKFTQVLWCVVCTLLRRHVHKQIRKRRYRYENPGHFLFGKPILFTLGLGLTMPYSLRFFWKFYLTFFIVCINFWMRFESQIRPTRFSIYFLFIAARVERTVCLCVKLFDYFSRWILICLMWNLSCFVPNSIQILMWNFRKNLLWDKFFGNFVKNQGYILAKFVKFRPTFCNFILGPYCVEKLRKNLHKYFHVLFSPC